MSGRIKNAPSIFHLIEINSFLIDAAEKSRFLLASKQYGFSPFDVSIFQHTWCVPKIIQLFFYVIKFFKVLYLGLYTFFLRSPLAKFLSRPIGSLL